jgi:hypothetical protein
MNRFVRLFVAVAIALVGSASFAMEPVSSHRAVTDGSFRFVAGWLEEPAIAGALNGIDLEIEWAATNRSPVLDAHENLTASLTKGSAIIPTPLAPQFGRPGRYTFALIPTEPGNYTLRVAGNMFGEPIDVTVDLDEVVTTSDLQFPTPGDPEGQVGSLQRQVGSLQGQVTALFVVATIAMILAGISATMLLLPKLPLRKRT